MGIIVIPRILWEWEKCGENTMGRSCGNRVGMECIHPETPRGHFRNLANDKNSGANRILDKLSCEMSYAQNVVDSWSSFAIFWSCCKNDDIATLVKCSTPCQ